MDRVYSSGAAGTAPTAPASPSTGYPTSGNPSGGTPATKPGPWWYHMITEEIRKVITDAGLTPDYTSVAQLSQAVSALAGTTFASGAEAQSMSIYDKALSPGTLNSALEGANQSLSASGYQKLPGGLIVQWGTATSSATSGTVSFPITFPNAVLIGNVFDSATGSTTPRIFCWRSDTTTTSVLGWQVDATPATYSWIAIGF